jgi:hypothetical protein
MLDRTAILFDIVEHAIRDFEDRLVDDILI